MSEFKFERRKPQRAERVEVLNGLAEHEDEKKSFEKEKEIKGLFFKILQTNSGIEEGFEEEGRHFKDSDDFYFLKQDRLLFERELARRLDDLVAHGDFEGIVEVARNALVHIGVKGAEAVTTQTPAAAVIISEAVNHAAKVYWREFYNFKPDLIVAAWKMGAHFGQGSGSVGEVVYYLGDPVTGVASFHDPDGDVAAIVRNCLHEEIPEWSDEWSGVDRSENSFDRLGMYADGEDAYFEDLAEQTLSEEDFKIRTKYLLGRRKAAITALGEYVDSTLAKIK
jgi:hypothetical protein